MSAALWEASQVRLPEPDETVYAQWQGEAVKRHSADKIIEFANARVAAALAVPQGARRRARKVGGSYEADGWVVAEFKTMAGAIRYVFEFDNPAGMLHIFNGTQLKFE